MLLTRSFVGLVAAALAARALPVTGQQEYSLLLRGRMGSTASPASDKAAYALEVDAADGATVLGQ